MHSKKSAPEGRRQKAPSSHQRKNYSHSCRVLKRQNLEKKLKLIKKKTLKMAEKNTLKKMDFLSRIKKDGQRIFNENLIYLPLILCSLVVDSPEGDFLKSVI